MDDECIECGFETDGESEWCDECLYELTGDEDYEDMED